MDAFLKFFYFILYAYKYVYMHLDALDVIKHLTRNKLEVQSVN